MSAKPAPLFERYARATTLRELLACVREFDARPSGSSGGTSIRLAIAGNHATQFLTKGFGLALAARGLVTTIHECEYNLWQQETLNPDSGLYRFAPSHVLLSMCSAELAFGALRTPEAIVDALAGGVARLLEGTAAQVFVTLPEPLADEVSDWSAAYAWRIKVQAGLRARLTDARVTLIDLEPLIRLAGTSAWYDERFYETAKLPFHPDRTPAVLARLADAIAGHVSQRVKLVIVDLDDTFWGGRVGDDGWEGIELDPAGPGRHFLALQMFLRGLREQGVVLAIASKNHPEPVEEVFARRRELLLAREDFVAAEIHWEPKSESVARILERLGLSTAGVVFLDDNPVERAEVRRRFPDLLIPELPEDPALRVPMLLASGLFDRRVVTEESRNRSRMYRENAQRDSVLSGAGDLAGFLRNLDMEMEVSDVREARDRVLELIHKTNQFNLTTRRYNWDQLLAVIEPGFGLCYRLRDRFGDNGIISVVLVTLEGQAAHIDLWLMSCRVLGRQTEDAILADVAARAIRIGATRLTGKFIPTDKNRLVAELYPRLGFATLDSRADVKRYELSLDHAPLAAAPIRMIDKTAVGA
jgi:FkbH-like protein